MAKRATGGSAKEEKARRLALALNELVSLPPYRDGFDPIAISRIALDRLPSAPDLSKPQAKKLREKFDQFIDALPGIRERLDPVTDPESSFDPGNPDTVGRLVVLALLAQDRVPLSEIKATYGSGVYAVYYTGEHPVYAEVANTETPLYVGKADPDEPRAANPRQQGVRLFSRLADHRKAIQDVENYAAENGIAEGLRVADFECRRLVCATNAQLVAERHLIDIFRPVWNSEMKICFGISKHGDSSIVRANNRSPWHVLHPGRSFALDGPVKVGMTPETIAQNVRNHFKSNIPERDLDGIMYRILDTFRQIGRTTPEASEAGAATDNVTSTQKADSLRESDPELGFE